MRKPTIVKFRNLKKYLRKFRIELKQGSKHPYFEDPAGNKYPQPFTKDNADVERVYVDAIRRKFRLTPEDGISDEQFYSRKIVLKDPLEEAK